MLSTTRFLAAAPGVAVALFMMGSVTQSACWSPAPDATTQQEADLTCANGGQRLNVPGSGDSCCTTTPGGSTSCTRVGAPLAGTRCTRPGERLVSERARIVKDTCVRESCNGDRDANPYVASADVELGTLVCAARGSSLSWQWQGSLDGIRATQGCYAVGPLYCGDTGGGYGYGYGGSTRPSPTAYGEGGSVPVARYVYPNPIQCTHDGRVVPCDLKH